MPRPTAPTTASSTANAPDPSPDKPSPGDAPLRRWLTTGVSHTIPFVVTGGMLIALAYLVGGPDVADQSSGLTLTGLAQTAPVPPRQILTGIGVAGLLYQLGSVALALLTPVLGGFIAYAVAGPLALVAGMVGGALASVVGAGYLGSLAAGLLSGGAVWLLSRLPSPRAVAGLIRVVVVPLVSTLAVGLVVVGVIGSPLAALQQQLTDGLGALSESGGVLLGLVLGLMVALDLGGPVNKAAYAFALAALAQGDAHVIAAVMAAGMAAPLSVALASTLRPQLFTEAERGAGRAAWALGASFVSEGAIPFAAADPVRVLPPLMAGSAAAGALSMALGATSLAPHGGIWVLPVAGHPLGWLLALVVGVLVGAGSLVAAKTWPGRHLESADR